jgi:hypothetical protein
MTDRLILCPRCAAAFVQPGAGPGRARSRATRDEGADIFVCSRCGEREERRESQLGQLISFADWPLAVDALLEEERLLIEWYRSVELPPPDD